MNMLCIQIKIKKQRPETKSTYHIRFNITLQYCTLVFGNSYITVE